MAKAVSVLALVGGRGARMDILCQTRPKPILQVCGNYRLIDFTLSNCIESKLSSLAVVTDYLREEAISYLDKWRRFNGKDLKLTVLQPQSGAYKGTADAVFQNVDYLDEQHSDIVMLLAGDHIYQMDYRKMLDFHLRTKAAVTVGVTRVPIKDVHRYGQIEIDRTNRISRFIEKPHQPSDNLVSMGIYVFDLKILKKYLRDDAYDVNSCHDFGYSVLPALVKNVRTFAYEFSGYWRDVGTIESYYQGNMDLLAMVLQGKTENWTIYSDRFGLSVCPLNNAFVSNSLIGRDCIIAGRVENSILGDRVVIDSDAIVKNSIILDDSYIGNQSEILNSVLDERVSIGSQSIIGYASEGLTESREITVVARRVNLPSHCIVGKHCTVIPSEANTSTPYRIEPREAAVP
jgi:glucose-1-phosphate adenylyltransferase